MVSGPINNPQQQSSSFTGTGDFNGQTVTSGGGSFGPTITRTSDPNARPVFGAGTGTDGQIMVGTGETYTTHPAVAPYVAYAALGMDYPTAGIGYTTVPASVYAGNVQRWGLSLNAEDQQMYLYVTGLLQDIGKLGETFSVEDASSAWQDVLLGASYNQTMSPMEYLELLASKAMTAPPPGAITATGTTSTSETSTSNTTDTETVLTNEFDARAILDNALLNYLGRRATDKERAAFLSSLNKMEQQNPTVTQTNQTSTTNSNTSTTETQTPAQPARPATTGSGPSSENGPAGRQYQPATAATGATSSRTTSINNDTNTSRNGTRTGGFNQEQYAVDYARSNPLYAETQAATTLMSWLERAIMNSQQRRMI